MVTKATPTLPSFGGFLTKIRRASGVKSQRQSADIMLRDLKSGGVRFPNLGTISDNQVRADEKGLVSDIPAVRLRAYADLYKVPYSEIVAQLVKEKYGVDLVPAEGSAQPKSIRDVVPQESAEILEEVYNLLQGEEGGRVKGCLVGLVSAFGVPNKPGSSATRVEVDSGKQVKQEGAA